MLILGDYKTMKNTTPVEEHEYPPLRMFQILFVDFFRERGGVPQICQMISTRKIRKGRGRGVWVPLNPSFFYNRQPILELAWSFWYERCNLFQT